MARFGRWIAVAFVFLGVAACSSEAEPAVLADTAVAGVETEPPWPSFFFSQDPLQVDVPTPSDAQLAELDAADVPIGTQVFIATTALSGSSSRIGEIRITDVMRGPESMQRIAYVLVGTEGQSDAYVGKVAYDICVQPDSVPTVIRGSREACAESVAASTQAPASVQAAWSENGVSYAANSRAAVSPAALVEWLDGLTFVEVGRDGGPYSWPFCSDGPSRCNG